MEFINSLLNLIQTNQTLLTVLGVGGAGTIIMWLKGIPQAIFNLLKREFTTEIIVTSQNIAFHNIMKLIEKKYADKNFRKLKLMNGMWGDSGVTMGIGYGFHIIRYKSQFLFLNLTKESANQTNYDKDNLSILKIGRSHSVFSDLIKEAYEIVEEKNTNKIYKMESDWYYIKDQKKRAIESVFLEKGKKDKLFNAIEKFIKNEDWYLKHGIPYQLGILLYGPPGTGKTSIIKAVASYFNYSIYYLPSSGLYKIEKAVSLLPDNSILVIEDIDTNNVTNSRDDENEEVKEQDAKSEHITSEKAVSVTEDEKEFKKFLRMGLSEILNSLDGIFSTHGRILIATTNHIEDLDTALIRPGRIDIKIEIGYVNNELLEQFCNSFYPNNNVDFGNIKIKSKITIAQLQNLILEEKSIEEVIEFVKEIQ